MCLPGQWVAIDPVCRPPDDVGPSSREFAAAIGLEEMQVRIVEVRDEARDIRSYCLQPAATGASMPAFSAGAHIDVIVEPDLVRQYSLCSDPADRSHYRIGVQKDPNSRGGSATLFETFETGSVIEISEPRNHFALDESGSDYTLIAGGIGITPILAMASRLAAIGKRFHLYYLARSDDRFGFSWIVDAPNVAPHVTRHCDIRDGLPDLKAVCGTYRDGLHIYCCGPGPLMDAVKQICEDWPPGTVVFEHFSRDDDPTEDSGDSFQVQIGEGGPCFTIGPGQSILEVLTDNGYKLSSQCKEGLCGTCEVGLLAGEADHRDLVLSDEEKAGNFCIMICISRAKSKKLVLDL